MPNLPNTPLTAPEVSGLWGQYINDMAGTCVLSHFLAKVEDEEVKEVIKFSLASAQVHLKEITEILKKNHFPIPIGFTEKDVNQDAPRLFSDSFVLMYLRNMSALGMAASGLALGTITRTDCILLHKKVLNHSIQLQDLTRNLMLEQGTYVRPPLFNPQPRVDFVQDQNFLTGFFGDKRPLTSVEATHLFINVQANSIGKALIMGFAQCATSKDVINYFLRGKKIAQKHVDLFQDILQKEDLPAPMSWDSAVSNSTASPFSEKLMMFHITSMIAAGIGNYGTAISASPRRDIGLKYASLIPEIALYAEDGANIMIKNGWLEQPPLSTNREKLAREKTE